MTKINFPPHVVAILAVLIIALFMVSAYLFGMWVITRSRDTERERLERENAKLMCKVEHYKREHRETLNKYADAANEAARLKGEKRETPREVKTT